jgi:hypothetical protein
MSYFFYKTQVQIVVISMTLHNYIRRKSKEDIAFREFDRHPDFVPDVFFNRCVSMVTNLWQLGPFAYEFCSG